MEALLAEVLVGLASTMAGTTFALLRRGAQKRRRREAQWQVVAQTLAGHVTAATFLTSTPTRISTVLEGVEIVVDTTAMNKTLYLRVTAAASAPPDFFLRVGDAGRDGLILADVGDAVFESMYRPIVTNDEGFARAWLALDVRAALVAGTLGACWIERPKEAMEAKVTSLVLDRDEDANRIVQIIEATAVFARSGTRLREDWAQLAREVGGVVRVDLCTSEAAAIDVATRVGRAVIEVVSVPNGEDDTTRVLRVRAGRPANAERFAWLSKGMADVAWGEAMSACEELPFEMRSADPVRTIARFDTAVVTAVQASRPAAIVGDVDSVAIGFGAITFDAKRLREALAVVCRLADQGPGNPYR